MNPEDAKLLRACLEWADEHDDEASEQWRGAFRDMLSRGFGLSHKQAAWIKGVAEKLGIADPQYENAWSAGKVPRGEKLATPVPEVLKKPLPLKPPGRRTT